MNLNDVVRKLKSKPCPFCGNKDVRVVPDWEAEERDIKDGTGYCAALCSMSWGGCGAVGPFRDNVQDAINAWNNRDEPKPSITNVTIGVLPEEIDKKIEERIQQFIEKFIGVLKSKQ